MDIFKICEYGDLKELHTLYNKKQVNIHTPKKLGNQGLMHFATKGRNLSIIEFLIGEGINLDQKDDKGNTPFHYIAWIKPNDDQQKLEKIAKLLVNWGASINISN